MALKKMLSIALIAFTALFTACTGSDENDDSPKSGTISGTAVFTTSDDSNAPANVKLAAVYYPEYATMSGEGSKIVSNVVDLGTIPDKEIAFSLDIDFKSVSPEIGSGIQLEMWTDSNEDNIMDKSETCNFATTNNECPVFGSSTFCFLIFSDEWLISTGKDEDDTAPFESAVKTGAKLISMANAD